MTTTAGFTHEAVVHAGREELLETVEPVLAEGLERGETVVLLCSLETSLELDERLGRPGDALVILGRASDHARPPGTLHWWQAFVEDQGRRGRRAVRALTEVPVLPEPFRRRERARLETVANALLAGTRLWSLCAYDEERLAPEQRAPALAAHPRVRRGGSVGPNPSYRPVREHLAELDAGSREPMEVLAPDLRLVVATVAEARAAVGLQLRRLRHYVALTQERTDGFLAAVEEVLTNAVVHGRPPVTVRLWAASSRLVCTVTDHGKGVADPLAGYLDDPGGGAHGLALARRLTDDLVMRRDHHGFTVRLALRW